jgi:hypothetical protein
MYLVDSDVFIEAKNRHYAFDVVPGFWDWLHQAHLAGRVFTVERVAQEVCAGSDDLAIWMKNRPATFAIKPGAADQAALQQIAHWAVNAPYDQGAAATFLSSGDYFLVAQALSRGFTVVTHEASNLASKKRIRIPDACSANGVTCMTPFRMLHDEGARFTLPPP